MKQLKIITTGFLVSAIVTALLSIGGCGSGGGGGTEAGAATVGATPTATVTGTAATGAPISGNVYLKDSGSATEMVATIGNDGSFSFNVSGLQAPFLIRAEWQTGTGVNTLYSFAAGAGRANVTPFSNALVIAAAGAADTSSLAAGMDVARMQAIATNLPTATAELQFQLRPLSDLYGANIDPIGGYFAANHQGYDAMLDGVAVAVTGGNLTVTNRANSSVIFSCTMVNIPGGHFTAANMPVITPTPVPTPTPTSIPTPTPAPTPLPGQAIYDGTCSGCHVLGSYDASGSAPNLSGRSALVSGKLAGGHMGISLTAAQISDLQAFMATK